jgi:hypothetical protein
MREAPSRNTVTLIVERNFFQIVRVFNFTWQICQYWQIRIPDSGCIRISETTMPPSTGAMHAELGCASSPTVTMSLELGEVYSESRVGRWSCGLLSPPAVSRFTLFPSPFWSYPVGRRLRRNLFPSHGPGFPGWQSYKFGWCRQQRRRSRGCREEGEGGMEPRRRRRESRIVEHSCICGHTTSVYALVL